VSRRWSFGVYQLDLVDRVLRNETQPVRLSARQFDLLAILVQRGGAVVTKDELLTCVWPGQVVEENNVAVHVSGLRRVLGRDAIDTVAGRGYRFALPVRAECREGALAAPPRATQADFRLQGLASVPHTLHGRASDLTALIENVSEHRLVTVVGSPGLGKSALALACAHGCRPRLRDGVVWVGLGRDDQPIGVVTSVATALGLDAVADLAAVLDRLRRLEALLVIDNAEVDADEVAAFAHTVLERTEHVVVLVTSRKVLRVSGGRTFRPTPLSVPSAGASCSEALQHGAVALFVDQARAQDQHFELNQHNVGRVIELCRRLDGLPLAIQLAAGRVPTFGIDRLCAHLDDRYRFLTRGMSAGPQRHRSLRAAMDLSHALLNDTERLVFARLASLDTSFTLEQAIGAVADHQRQAWDIADALEGLVDQSLVLVEPGERPRYRLLQSTRAYALLRLEETRASVSAARLHTDVLRSLFERAAHVLTVRTDALYLEPPMPQLDELHAALDWYLANDPAAGAQLTAFSRSLFELLSMTYEPRARHAAHESVWSPYLELELPGKH
jgi:predicted ATPase/DNA-binding winged helix-turn-helix (wHTH) protein